MPERTLDPLVEGALLAHAGDAKAVRHVLEDALRERVRLLEDHAHVAADEHRIDFRRVDAPAVEEDAGR